MGKQPVTEEHRQRARKALCLYCASGSGVEHDCLAEHAMLSGGGLVLGPVAHAIAEAEHEAAKRELERCVASLTAAAEDCHELGDDHAYTILAAGASRLTNPPGHQPSEGRMDVEANE